MSLLARRVQTCRRKGPAGLASCDPMLSHTDDENPVKLDPKTMVEGIFRPQVRLLKGQTPHANSLKHSLTNTWEAKSCKGTRGVD